MQLVNSFALAGVLAITALAAPAAAAPVSVQESVAAPQAGKENTEAADYGTREAQSPGLQEFAAGDTIVIGSTVAAAILIVAVLVLLL